MGFDSRTLHRGNSDLNRAHEEGYDFALLIPLDKPPTKPVWFPKNRLWLGLERWGIATAAAIIEARVQELGGSPRQETIEERAARHARDVSFRAEREAALNSFAGVQAFQEGLGFIADTIKDGVERINSGRTAHRLDFRPPRQRGGPCYVLGLKKGLSVSGRPAYTNTLENVFLEAKLWNGAPPIPGLFSFEEPTIYMTERYQLDYLTSRTYAWTKTTEPNRSFSSNDLAEEILKWLFIMAVTPLVTNPAGRLAVPSSAAVRRPGAGSREWSVALKSAGVRASVGASRRAGPRHAPPASLRDRSSAATASLRPASGGLRRPWSRNEPRARRRRARAW